MRRVSFKKLFLNIISFTIVFGVYFWLMDKHMNFMHTAIISVFVLFAFTCKYIKVDKVTIMYIFIVALFFISAFILNIAAIKYTIIFFVGVILFNLISNNQDIMKYFIKYFSIFSFIFAIATIMSAINMDIFSKLYDVIFDSDRATMVYNLGLSKAFSGIAGQNGINAYVISIGLILLFINITNKKARVKDYMLLVIYIVALLLTAKRAFIVYDLVVIIVLLWLKDRKKLNTIVKGIIISIIFFVIIYFIIAPFFPSIFYVFERLFNSNDFSNGRIVLYELAFDLFKANSLYGIGLYNFTNMAQLYLGKSNHAHNVVIQLFTEMGIFQAIFIICVIVYTYILSIKKINKSRIYGYYSIGVQTLFILYFITGNPLYDFNTLYSYFIFLGLAYANSNEINEKTQ